MTARSGLPRAAHSSGFTLAVALIAAALGGFTLFGWFLDLAALRQLGGMAAATALALVLAGGALGFLREKEASALVRGSGLVCALGVVLIGVLALGEYAYDRSLGLGKAPIGAAGISTPSSSEGMA